MGTSTHIFSIFKFFTIPTTAHVVIFLIQVFLQQKSNNNKFAVKI